MTELVENYVDRYMKRHQLKIQQICEPLHHFFGVNYFTYHSVTSDGYWRPPVSRLDWADFYTENQLYLYDPMITSSLHRRF